MTTWILDRLSTEWVGPITVTVDGNPVTGWTYTVLPHGERPADVAAIASEPTETDDGAGILVGPGTDHEMVRGQYRIWIRYVDDPEAPVLDGVGWIVIT